MEIIDVAQDVSHYAEDLFRNGVRTVIRYYNHQNINLPSKRLELSEKKTLIEAGLSIAVVFQQRAGAGGHISDLTSKKGKRDGKRAMQLAEKLDQPKGSAIYFAVDHDFVKKSDLTQIVNYFASINAVIGSSYQVGVYGSGYVARILLDKSLVQLAWLSLSRGWTGYKSFQDSLDWALLQQHSRTWPNAGFSYDTNIVNTANPDFGQFPIETANSGYSEGKKANALLRVVARDGLNLRNGPGTEYAKSDTLPYGTIVHGYDSENGWISVDTEGDGRLDGHMFQKYLEPFAGAFPTAHPIGLTPYEIAQYEHSMNVKEIPGPKSNPRIYMYHASTGHGDKDEIAWCSSFVNYCVTKAGLIGTNSKWALTWHTQKWGKDVTESARKGDIAVFSRSKNGKVIGGHVGFVISDSKTHIKLLGGNQSDSVTISTYPKNGKLGSTTYKLKSIRRPEGFDS